MYHVLYIVQCTLCTQYSIYSVKCILALYNVYCTMQVQYTLLIVQYKVYISYNVQCNYIV